MTYIEARLSQTDKETSALKSYIVKLLRVKGVQPTGSSRGGIHVRFPLPIAEKEWPSFFKSIGLALEDFPEDSISGSFATYVLKTTKASGSISKGMVIPWVNNHSGRATSGERLFGNKELTPDALGLAGQTLDMAGILRVVGPRLKKKYDAAIYKVLMDLLHKSNTKQTSIPLDPAMTLATTDLSRVSADFGEIMSAIWAMNHLRFRKVFFPLASNEPLVDFYGIRLGIQYPVSVKSGGGGKVTIQNIVNAIENRAKTARQNVLAEEKSLQVFKTVDSFNAKEGMIELHRLMDTPSIKKLATVTGIRTQDMNVKSLTEWAEPKSKEELITALTPFWEVGYGKPGDRIIDDSISIVPPDKYRLIGSPLGETIWRVLNDNREIKTSLTNVARQVALIQVNVDVKKRLIKFKANQFRDANFEFNWAGYRAGNKLGFKMDFKE